MAAILPPAKRGRPPKAKAPEVKAPVVSTKLGNKSSAKALDTALSDLNESKKLAKHVDALEAKADKVKLSLKAALKQAEPTQAEEPAIDSVSTPSAAPSFPDVSPPPPTVTHVNTALPQAPARKLSVPTKRTSSAAAGKLSFNDLLTHQHTPKETPSPLTDILKYRK